MLVDIVTKKHGLPSNVPPTSTVKKNRFKVATSEQGSPLHCKAPLQNKAHSGPQGKGVKGREGRLVTLNILEMQPEFQDPHLESGVLHQNMVAG